MENDNVIISFALKEHELASLDRMAERLKLNRSALIRVLAFMQMDEDNCNWLIPLAQSKGVAPWEYLNIILRSFKKRALQADADKNLVFEGS